VRPAPRHPLDPRAVSFWRLQGLVRTALLGAFGALSLAGAIVMSPAGPLFLLALVACVGLYGLFALLIAPAWRYRVWRYDVSEHELELQHGLFVVSRTLIPLVRVQHVDTRQGPLLKYFSLSTVTVSTAAGTHEIPALSDEVADQLRDHISALAQRARESL